MFETVADVKTKILKIFEFSIGILQIKLFCFVSALKLCNFLKMNLDSAWIESQSMESLKPLLPYFLRGKVVKGFGRGSKQLGCPTGSFLLFYEIFQ